MPPLSHSDHRYRRLFETIHIGIMLLNFKNRVITDVNPYMARLCGYKINEIVGKKISELDIFEKEFNGKKIFNELKKKKEVIYEIPLHSKKGIVMIVELTAHTYMSDSQTMVQCTVRDLTEKRTAQKELFESNQRLEALMNALPVGVSFSLDPKVETIRANPYQAQKMGIASEDNISVTSKDRRAVGKKLRHIFNGRELKPHELPMQRAIATNKVVGPYDGEVELPNGKRWLIEAYAAPVHDKNGKVIGAVAVNMDITERKKAEEADRLALIVKQEQEKFDFIADATHELRTPLAIIRGNVELALHKKVISEDALESINAEVIHLTSILSDFSLLTTKDWNFKKNLESHRVRLSVVVKAVADRHRGMASKKKISIEVGKLPRVIITGDDYYIERLFTNIFTNAISYGKENGHIWVSGRIEKSQVKIKIKDDGVGISETDLPFVFERFYRAEGSRSKDHGGSGLGLAIVKWVAEAHGGSVGVESTLEQGSTFTVSFPLPKKS